jgi:hypothetical protein
MKLATILQSTNLDLLRLLDRFLAHFITRLIGLSTPFKVSSPIDRGQVITASTVPMIAELGLPTPCQKETIDVDLFSVVVKSRRCPVEIRLSPPWKNIQVITSADHAVQILLDLKDQQHLQASSRRSAVICRLAVESRRQLVDLSHRTIVGEVEEQLSVPDICIGVGYAHLERMPKASFTRP